MTPINVKVFVESHAAHTTQFYSGLYMLRDQGLVNVQLAEGKYDNGVHIRIEVNEVPVYIDLADHATISKEEKDRCKFYFKRMLLKPDAATYPGIYPYGFNYPVFYKNDHTLRRSFFSKNRQYALNTFLRSSKLLSALFKINLGHHTSQVHNFENKPVESDDNKVIFSARLWTPDKPKSPEKQQQRRFMNEQRIAIVKEGRKRLGKQFIGGIDRSDYALQIAPDALVKSNDFSHKKHYLQLLKDCSIGIANAGLEGSIGFKFAEYISMSKAIVTSRIDQYLLPGNFSEMNNYLTFDDTAEDCISKCKKLMEDKPLLNKMMLNNHLYYNEYLRPDKLVMNILKIIVSD